MQTNKPNIIVDKTLQFSLSIITYVELLESKRKYVIANQLIKSGTSVGANVREAQNAESEIDFIHKMKIAAKEMEETKYWLHLCQLSDSYPNCEELQSKAAEITKIISSSKNNKLLN